VTTAVPADLRIVVTTCPPQHARELAEALVRGRFAACCNALPGVTSTYWWRDELCTDAEAILLFKTTASRVAALSEALLAQHPYDTPELVVLSVEQASRAYGAWVAVEVAVVEA
jgi:periplasmic divalent cation tolerance protein